MHPHDDVVLGGVGVGHLRQGESTDAGGAVSNSDGLHGNAACHKCMYIWDSLWYQSVGAAPPSMIPG